MKIVIYGVSRSGKDYLIDKIMNSIEENAFHLQGSIILNEISENKYDCKFNNLDDKKKELLRKEFTEIVKIKENQYDVIFVDGHFSFLNDSSFNVVFTDNDKLTYDYFFYLDTPSEMILEFTKNSLGEKQNLLITEKEIDAWKEFEKKELAEICKNLNKELVILDEDTGQCVEFIKKYISEEGRYLRCPEYAAKELIDGISFKNDTIIVSDCDKTISINDITYEFCSQLNIEGNILKQIFKNDRYSIYQFYKVLKLYSKFSEEKIIDAINFVKEKVEISSEIVKDIKQIKNSSVIGLTSGILYIWQEIDKKEKIFDLLLGTKFKINNSIIITPKVKCEIVKLLKKEGKTVIAVGDSIIDIPMINAANRGYIIIHDKLNDGIKKYVTENNLNIKQVNYSSFKYENIEIAEEII